MWGGVAERIEILRKMDNSWNTRGCVTNGTTGAGFTPCCLVFLQQNQPLTHISLLTGKPSAHNVVYMLY